MGKVSDMLQARQLMETRVALPCADLAKAYLSLFDAFVAQRCGQLTKAHGHAHDAVNRFEALQWNMYVDLARSILPPDQRSSNYEIRHKKPFPTMGNVLTKRERDVADLLLKGLTNRAIAGELSISPHTVDSHINSIMRRLGIRSRYQLADALVKE
jgi:DNA-binding NarL/FixJ family response regulator